MFNSTVFNEKDLATSCYLITNGKFEVSGGIMG